MLFKHLFLSLISSLIFCAVSFAQDIFINEFVSSNDTIIEDSFGEFSDWIELYNAGSEVVNLKDFAISDKKDNLRRWVFPEVLIQPKGFILIFASGNDIRSGQELHTNFSISQWGEPLILTNNKGRVIDSVDPIVLPPNHSYARLSDGNSKFSITSTPTPNASNNGYAGIYISHKSGFYRNEFDLILETSNPNAKIYYTTNGSLPTPHSNLYTKPITIADISETAYSFSAIPTTPLDGEYQLYKYIWKEPQSVYKSNIIRYAMFENGEMQQSVHSKTYFVGRRIEQRYQFPVISFVSDSLNLFDHETGIYVPGKQFDEDGFNWWPSGNYHNRGREWERDVHFTFFDETGTVAFETDAGIRMRGYGSTAFPQKSFNVYFRKEYGISRIEFPLFDNFGENVLKRLILRNSGNDFLNTHFRDAMLQQIISPLNLELQDFAPSILFINGEYWGIYNIREKYDKYYFEYRFGIEEDNLNILDVCGHTVEEGDNADYLDLVYFIESNDLSVHENYEYVASEIDIDNFIDYLIVEIYFANFDWPCNNYKMWKTNDPGSKWRFLIYDLDLSFAFDSNSAYDTQSLEHATSTENSWPFCECSTLLFRKLLENETFVKLFLDRFVYSLENIFETNRVIGFIDDFERLYYPEMKEHIERWNYPKNIKTWMQEVNKMRKFAVERPCYMSENIISFFELKYFDFQCDPKAEKKVIVLYPNPNRGNFSIENITSEDIENGIINLINSSGQLVYSQSNVNLTAGERISLHLNHFPKGFYIFSLIAGNVNDNIKILIQ